MKISVQFDTYFAAAATAVRLQLLISAQREILELFPQKFFFRLAKISWGNAEM